MSDNQLKPQWKRRFFIITAGQAVSLVGSSAVQFALIWSISIQSASPIMLSLAGLLAFLPQLILGPFVGVLIDRVKRKTVMICADLFIGFVAMIFSLFCITGQPPVWASCVVLGVRAIGNVFHTPAIQSVIPLLVPTDELIRVNGWTQFLQSGAFMLGPVLGAAMYAVLPFFVILLSDLVGALVASATVFFVEIPELPPSTQAKTPHFFREMKEGVTIFLKDRRLAIVTFAAMIGMIFFMPVASFYPLMTSDYFSASAWHASIVELLYAGGMLLCAAIAGFFGTVRDKLRLVHFGLFGMGISVLLCGILPPTPVGFWIFALLCFILGGSGNLYNIPYIAYLQETIPPELQGRAFSMVNSLMSITMPLGLFIAGPVAEAYGVSLWFFVAGAVFLPLAFFSALLTWRSGVSLSNLE